MNLNNLKLTIREKIGYAMGDAAANIAWRPLISFLPIFYTDTFGLPIAASSLLLAICRSTDGVTDVIMGTIADRTNTRWGKFRPWILWTALPFGVLLALTFTTPDLSQSGKLIWAYITYIFLILAYTANNVPYSALMGVMTPNLKERTSISSFRFFGAYGGAAIAVGLIPYLVGYIGKGNDNIGYQKTMYLLAGLLVIFSLITFISTKERVFPPKNQTTNILNDFKDLIRNKPWTIMLIIGFLFVTYNSIKQGIAMYFFSHYIGNSVLGGVYLLSLLITSIFATFLATPLTEYFGKKKLFIIVLLFSGLVNTLLFFAGPNDVYYVFIIGNISEVGAAIMPILFFSMLGDTADYSEYRNHRRATGLIFSAGTFAMKFGGGVAGAIMLLVMNFFGYDGKAEVKTQEALLGIRLDMSIVPLIFIILAVIIISFYPLTQTKMIKIEEDLKKRRKE